VPIGIVTEAAWNVKVLSQRRGQLSDVKVLLAHTVSDLDLSPHRVKYVAFAAIMSDTTLLDNLGYNSEQRSVQR
jgi:hypothetical protein